MPGTFAYSPPAGTVLPVGTGQPLSATFTPTDTATYATAAANVTITVTRGVPTITWPTPAAIVYGTLLSATQLNASANVPGTFAYTPAAGTLLSAGATQTLNVTFTPADTASYDAATASVAISVVKATPAIAWSAPSAIGFGTVLTATQLNAIANVRGTFVYSPSAGAVLSPGTQTLAATFTPDDTGNYTAGTASVSLVVLKGTPDITWPRPGDIFYGTPLGPAQLDATSSVPGVFAYSPAAGTVLPAGVDQTLSVTFTPADPASYTTASFAVAITVLKTTPTITWPTPADIAYGTALGASQLNASVAGVPGTFVYSPTAGTVLGAGAGQTAVGDLHADRRGELHDRDQERGDQRVEGRPGDHLADTGRDYLWHGTWADAAECDVQHARDVRLHSAGRHGTQRGDGADVVDDVHADRYRELHDRDQDGLDQRPEGDTGHHVGEPGRHHDGHGPGRDAAECDGQHTRDVCLHPSRRHRAERGSGTDAVGDVHADRRRELHDGDEDRLDQRGEDNAGDHVGERGGHHVWHRARLRRS